MSPFRKGLWQHLLTRYPTPDDLRRMVNQTQEWGFDLLIPCVKMVDGWADYYSQVALVRPGWEFDPLLVVAEEANRIGLEVHPWSCVFVESLDPTGSALMQAHPEARGIKLTDAGPEGVGWACPSHEAVRDYNVALCEEILENYPVQGVHLDYIRNGGFTIPEGCQCEVCRAKFNEITGEQHEKIEWTSTIGQSAEPYTLLSRWRAAQVSDVVRRVHEAAAARDKVVSAAVFSNFPVCQFDQGQDWVGWAHAGIIDYLFPMTYISLPEVVKWWTESYVAMVKGKAPIWPGLCFFHEDMKVETIAEQATLAQGAGAEGIVIFEYTGMNDAMGEAMRSL
jgi:uncharacterized lipoprotein YddW (UPF0748 family)